MPTIAPTVEPEAVGLSGARLATIASHFDRYVDNEKLPGWLATVSRRGEVAYVGSGGFQDREAGTPIAADTIFRIYSMTKPIVTVAAMRLWEMGRFELTDEIAPILGCFDKPMIFTGGTRDDFSVVPAEEPIRMWHLLSHTAGLTAGFQRIHTVDAIYRAAGYDFGSPPGVDLAHACEDLSRLPLLFEPGTAWNYSVATDIVGRVIEVLTGDTLDVALRTLVLDPLQMAETDFSVPIEKEDRLAQLYLAGPPPERTAVALGDLGAAALRRPTMLSGGGGLCSTAHDYRRFTSMLLRGGALDGVRVLSPRTLSYMTRNHLPGGVDLESMAQDSFSETSYAGVGFGLGFSVVLDATRSKVPTSEGSYAWGGAASTAFWVDPSEELEVSFFTQVLPSGTHPLRSQMSQLVYSSIID